MSEVCVFWKIIVLLFGNKSYIFVLFYKIFNIFCVIFIVFILILNIKRYVYLEIVIYLVKMFNIDLIYFMVDVN